MQGVIGRARPAGIDGCEYSEVGDTGLGIKLLTGGLCRLPTSRGGPKPLSKEGIVERSETGLFLSGDP